jgi:hypothetical protein
MACPSAGDTAAALSSAEINIRMDFSRHQSPGWTTRDHQGETAHRSVRLRPKD